jgi:TolB-like protein
VLAALLALHALALSGPSAAAPVPGPVAVLPFKNLNTDPKLDWLKLGIAETMVADLRRGKKVEVVERSQIDRALGELALAEKKETEEGTAAKVGKLVGAKTVVLGSFQKAGKELRISARFVAVETGVVLEAAKATGPMDRVFALQDEVVAKLVGKPPEKRARAGKKMLVAYELYAKSLSVASDADRVGLLREAVAADPELVYAKEELDALLDRMRGYSKTSGEKLAGEEAKLLARADDARAPAEERRASGQKAIDAMIAARRWYTLAKVAPGLATVSGLAEGASFGELRALLGLHRFDDALRSGEKFLAAYPTSARFREVESAMAEVVGVRKKRERRRAEYQKDLDEKLHDLAERKPSREKTLDEDYAPCICARWNSLVGEVMLAGCKPFVEKHGGDATPEAAEKLSAARFFVGLSLAEQGDLAGARAMFERVKKDAPDWDEEIARATADWPTDSP